MADSWSKLTKLTDGVRFVVERVRLLNSQIAIEGEFHLSPLAQLTADEQEFVMAFLRSRGNLREMERIFGISYPTVKNRLNRIADRLEPVECRCVRPGLKCLLSSNEGTSPSRRPSHVLTTSPMNRDIGTTVQEAPIAERE